MIHIPHVMAPGGVMLGCAGASFPLSHTALAGVVLLSIGGVILLCYGAYTYQQHYGSMCDRSRGLDEVVSEEDKEAYTYIFGTGINIRRMSVAEVARDAD